jgi:hypothetical protein
LVIVRIQCLLGSGVPLARRCLIQPESSEQQVTVATKVN